MKTKLNYLMMLLALLTSQVGWADIVTTTYDFAASVQNGNTTTQFSTETINVGGVPCTVYSSLGNVQNPGRFATQNTGMILRSASSSSGTTYGLCETGVGTNQYRTFVINNLYAGDVVTINGSTTFSLTSGNATANGNTFTMSSKGALGISLAGTQWIYSITIQHDDAAAFSYDPAVEIYDLFYVTTQGISGTNLTGAGFPLDFDDLEAQYLNNLQGGMALNNRIAISQVKYNGNTLTPWTLQNQSGLKSQWNWHNLAICNLREGDRVVIQLWSGEAKFSSKAENMEYNGCSAFKDVQSNGDFDEGEDTYITCGMSVESFATYVITEDGHLDIALAADAIICKITIYGDHQARMVDRYGNTPGEGNTSYFDTTGQLEAKHHIVPGGLHVYVGNEDEAQHAEVVMTDKGPASFVYDGSHFKMARTATWGNVNVSSELPISGTYYKFVPDVSGTMTVRFKANSITYRNYGLSGNAAVDQAGTPNEVISSTECPYYLMKQNGNQPQQVLSQTKGNGADLTFSNIEVAAGQTYYIYGWWQDGTNSSNLSNYYCGVAELVDVTFKATNYIYPLAKWVGSGATASELSNLATVYGYSDVCIKKKSDNIASCTVAIDGGTLKVTNISYKAGANPGGTVLIKVGDKNNDAAPVFALTIAYDANWNNGEGHTWNFSDNSLNGLKWTNRNSQEATVTPFGSSTNSSSLLSEEINKGDWTFNYRVKSSTGTNHDPRYLNNYDMEGDNADMMWDTEGLIINTSSNQSCIYEGIEGTVAHTSGQSDPDRYIGILPGGEFIIPKLKADDRVIIYMGSGSGSGSNTMHFNITNALDAVHNEIIATDDYYAGGSQWNVDGNNHDDPYYRGCYHFFAKADGDMVFKLVGGSMCKLYSIQIYRGERINTNGVQEIPGNGYVILATEGETGETKSWNLHYRGKGETLANGTGRYEVANEVIANSTNIEDPTITTDGNSISFTNPGSIGMIRVRAKCMEYNHNYVTDFADRNLTLAYHQMTEQYPYTWDFTDIAGFSSAAITGENEKYNELGEGYDYEPRGRELSMWDENGAMVIYCTDGDYYTNQNMIFENSKGINGNQLFANGAVIPETKGLWFYFDNNDPAYNGCMRIAADGLHLANASYENGTTCEPGVSLRRGWWNYKMVLPSVPAGAAVYLRMARDMSVKEGDISFHPWSPTNNAYVDVTEPFFYKKFQFGWMSDKAEIGTDNTDICKYYQASDGTGDYIVAIKNSGETSNLTFTLNGWTLKKMSVATDSKTVNKYGWNTESREHAIDPSLTAFLTGKDFRSYIVTDANREANTVTLARIDGGSGTDGDATGAGMKLIVPGATKVVNGEVVHDNGSKNAYIIRNAGGEAVDIFDTGSGFHLFVPDMHDAESVIPATNLLKAQLSTTANSSMVPRDETITNGEQSTTYNNYAFTYKYKKVDESGNPYTGPQEGEQAFYRIVSGGASSGGHQAYLSIAATPVVPAGARAMAPAYAASQPAEYYSILFQEWNNLDQLKGDVNADGRFNKLDVNTTADYVAGRPAGIFKGLADMNDDGRVDIVDLTLMIRKISGE